MKEALDNARQELQRVDHLFYVSLKYTRTVDMMRHMIKRLINAFSFGVESLLKYAKEQKMIENVPSNPKISADLLMKTFTDKEITEYMNLYLKLRKIIKVDYAKGEEYRRHVTMTCTIDNDKIIEINIDVLKEHYDAAKNFIAYVERVVEGKEED